MPHMQNSGLYERPLPGNRSGDDCAIASSPWNSGRVGNFRWSRSKPRTDVKVSRGSLSVRWGAGEQIGRRKVMRLVNTTPKQDKILTKAEDAEGLFQELLYIITELDERLSDANSEIEELEKGQ